LNGSQNRLLLVRSDGGYKGDDDSGDVGRDLELQKLANGVVDTTTLHDSLHDRSEVVVHENNVRNFLGDLGTGDSHRWPVLRAGPSFVPSPVTPTISPRESGGFQREPSCLQGKTGQDLETIAWVESAESGTLHDDTTGGVDAVAPLNLRLDSSHRCRTEWRSSER